VIFVLISISGLLFACNPLEDERITKTNVFRFQPQKEIQVDTTTIVIPGEDTVSAYRISVIEGNHLVFMYRAKRQPPENVDDGGFEEILMLSLSKDQTKFRFENDELNEIPVYYSRRCTFCPGSGFFFRVSSGFLEGEKLSETVWNIRISINVNLLLNETRRVDQRRIFVIRE